jgi:hypothetical protein
MLKSNGIRLESMSQARGEPANRLRSHGEPSRVNVRAHSERPAIRQVRILLPSRHSQKFLADPVRQLLLSSSSVTS